MLEEMPTENDSIIRMTVICFGEKNQPRFSLSSPQKIVQGPPVGQLPTFCKNMSAPHPRSAESELLLKKKNGNFLFFFLTNLLG